MNHSSSGATVGLTANPELRAFIELLHEHNLESVVELPVIAVVGDTSSGKSSLLSALSGFEFPSHSDICTRCPTRLHLERRARPSYGVSIEWKQTKKGQQFSKDCSTLEELNDLMIQAQNLVRKSSTTAISSDVVHVKICEPDVVDLTIVDLPGLVRTTGKDEDPEMIFQIRKIVDEYLQNSRCVIIAIHPANIDFHNSQVMHDARQHDPTTKRTFPVVTKADLIEEGNEQSVIDLIRQKKTERFELGFHLVKCRSQKEMLEKVTIPMSIEHEKNFFATRKGLHLDHNDTGVDQLKKKLSSKYLQMITEYAPAIKNELRARWIEANEKLKRSYIPRGPAECERFFRSITENVLELFKLFDKPKGLIALPYLETVASPAKQRNGECYKSNEADGEEDFSDEESDEGGEDGEHDEPSSVAEKRAMTYRAKLESLKLEFFDSLVELSGEKNVKSAAEICLRISATKKCTPRAFVDQELFCELIREELELSWRPRVDDFLNAVTELLKSFFSEIDKRIVDECKLPGLRNVIRAVVADHLDQCVAKGREATDKRWSELYAVQPTNNDYTCVTTHRKRARDAVDELRGMSAAEPSSFATAAVDPAFTTPKTAVRSSSAPAKSKPRWVTMDQVEKVLMRGPEMSIDEYLAEEARIALCAYLRTLAKMAGDELAMCIESNCIHSAINGIDFFTSIPPQEREKLLEATPETVLDYEALHTKVTSLAKAVAKSRFL